MAVTKRLNRRYQIGTGDVILRLVVGEGQFGSSFVEVDNVEVASGGVAMVRLGAGGDLVDKVARVITTVSDVQRSTNRTSMRYVLSGGPAEEPALRRHRGGLDPHARADRRRSPLRRASPE